MILQQYYSCDLCYASVSVCTAAACLCCAVIDRWDIPASHLHLDLCCGVRMDVGSHVTCFTLVDHAFKELQLPVLGKCTVIAFFPAAFSGTAAVGCECQLTVSALNYTKLMSNQLQLLIMMYVQFT
jgi:hypothetical protein